MSSLLQRSTTADLTADCIKSYFRPPELTPTMSRKLDEVDESGVDRRYGAPLVPRPPRPTMHTVHPWINNELPPGGWLLSQLLILMVGFWHMSIPHHTRTQEREQARVSFVVVDAIARVGTVVRGRPRAVPCSHRSRRGMVG